MKTPKIQAISFALDIKTSTKLFIGSVEALSRLKDNNFLTKAKNIWGY